jgi:hypothetical protein
MGAMLLGKRLFERFGAIKSNIERVAEIQIPEWLLTQVQQGTLKWGEIPNSAFWGWLSDEFPDYVARRGGSWQDVARAFWRAWLESDKQRFPEIFFRDERKAARFWEVLPVEAVPVLTFGPYRWVPSKFPQVLQHFRKEHWDAFLAALKGQKDRGRDIDDEKGLWWAIPQEHFRLAVIEGLISGFDHAILRALWTRFPEMARDQIASFLSEGNWAGARHILWSAGREQAPKLLTVIELCLERPDAPRVHISEWLHYLVGERVPEWERAWTLLLGLAPARE